MVLTKQAYTITELFLPKQAKTLAVKGIKHEYFL